MLEKIPCTITDQFEKEFDNLPDGPCKEALAEAVNRGFPWQSIDYGPIRRSDKYDKYIEWDIPNPEVLNLPIDDGSDPPPPDIKPLAYRIYGSIGVDPPAEEDQPATIYFWVAHVKEVIPRFIFQRPPQPPSRWNWP